MTTHPPEKIKFFAELEGLRGFLAWWVVFDHLLASSNYSLNELHGIAKIVRQGWYAVDVFIMLSGFVICLVLDKQGTAYFPFIVRRFFRLYPVYLLCLLLGLLGWHVSSLIPDKPADWNYFYSSTMDHLGAQFLVHLTMLHGVIPNEVLPFCAGAILIPAWSISLEWQFYLIAPWAFALATRWRWGFILLGLLIIILNRLVPYVGTFSFTPFLPIKLALFFLGALSYFFAKNFRGFGQSLPTLDLFLVTAILTPIFFLRGSDLRLPLLIWLPCLVLVTRNGAPDGPLSKLGRFVLNLPVTQMLGRISYVTYLIHMPVIQIAMWLVVRNFSGLSRPMYFTALVLISAPVILGLSLLVSRFIERPGIEWGRRLTEKF